MLKKNTKYNKLQIEPIKKSYEKTMECRMAKYKI